MFIQFIHEKNKLIIGGKQYPATCIVRNEINGWRKNNEIVKTFPLDKSEQRLPYMPREFPTGIWEVTMPIWTGETDYYPVKIPTTAKRVVRTWEVNNGEYTKPTDHYQIDAFYHLHYSQNSSTTLGCIRIGSEDDASEIAMIVESEIEKGNKVYLEVI